MPLTDVPAGLERGACPSVRRPFQAVDGGLARVRLPGGVLDLAGARALAAAAACYGSGVLEITNRANLQIRGVADAGAAALAGALVAAGLAHADPAVDERRNVMASPTAGVDPGELVDTGPLVTVVTQALADLGSRGDVSPKFGVLVDAGGHVSVAGRRQHLGLALLRWRGELRIAVHLDEALPRRDDPAEPRYLVPNSTQGGTSGPTLHAGRAPHEVADQVAAIVRAAAELDVRDLVARSGRHGALAALERAAGLRFECVPGGEVHLGPGAEAEAATPLGVHRQRQPGLAWVGAAPVLGRLDAFTLDAVAGAAEGRGALGIRLTPWRSLVVRDVPEVSANALARDLTGLGLVTDPDDPATTVVACAGSTGCAQGLADTQADAARLIDSLRALPPGDRPRSAHLSGCPKRCASRAPAAVTLIAGPAPGRYGPHAPEDALRAVLER